MTTFQDTWSSQTPHQRPVHLSKLSQMALEQLQTRDKGKLSGWLADVVASTPADSDKRTDTWLISRYRLIEASSRIWIDSIFSELAGFVREFNASDKAQYLQIALEKPRETMQLPCKHDASSEPYLFGCYEGHLASCNWALLIRTYYEAIQIYILPAEMLLGLEFNQLSTLDVKPFAEFRPAVNGNQVEWSLAGVTVTRDSIPAMAREVFADFIQVALGMLDESNLFSCARAEEQPPSNAQEDAFKALMRDLQLWQVRGLISRAIAGDIQSLAEFSSQGSLDADLQAQASLLEAGCLQLDSAWRQFLTALDEVSLQNKAPLPA